MAILGVANHDVHYQSFWRTSKPTLIFSNSLGTNLSMSSMASNFSPRPSAMACWRRLKLAARDLVRVDTPPVGAGRPDSKGGVQLAHRASRARGSARPRDRGRASLGLVERHQERADMGGCEVVELIAELAASTASTPASIAAMSVAI